MSELIANDLNARLKERFAGRIVRKDLTKSIKEGANVPVYVLEFLLGQYCSSDYPMAVAEGISNVKQILADNFVRPDEAQKVLSRLRENGSYTVIDRITVELNLEDDRYEATFSNLGVKDIPISSEYVSQYDRLLCGGIWCIVQLEYEYNEQERNATPIRIHKLTPIQMPHIDMQELKQGRKAFTRDEWITILLRSTGMEASAFTERQKWLLLARMIPLVENNFNLCELGPRSTGKSHLYKEISPNSILVSGGQTTVANLFYNMASRQVGLVGLWDCIAFDEVAGIRFKDKDGVQIMKDYMASGSFARGKEEKAAYASMVFMGNINQSVESLQKTSQLFEPFPEAMACDTAFLDRMHCYVPGWEIPKYRPHFFTDDFGFITDYLSEFMRQMRKETFGDACDAYFRFGTNLNQRDVIAVRKMISGFTKLLYPDGVFNKEDMQEILTISLEMRRRVKEQLKKIGGMEFYDVNFSYIDSESFEEHYVSVPEQGGGKLIPEGISNAGNVYTISHGKNGMYGVFRLETQMLTGNGKFERTGLGSDRDAKEATNTAFNYLKANARTLSSNISTTTKDYMINYQDISALNERTLITAASAARALFETACALHVEANEVISDINNAKVKGIKDASNATELSIMLRKKALKIALGTRQKAILSDHENCQRTNIMTLIEKALKRLELPDYIRYYEKLCDAVHPSFESFASFVDELGVSEDIYQLRWIINRYALRPNEIIDTIGLSTSWALRQLLHDLGAFYHTCIDLCLSARIFWIEFETPVSYYGLCLKPNLYDPCPCGSGSIWKICSHPLSYTEVEYKG